MLKVLVFMALFTGVAVYFKLRKKIISIVLGLSFISILFLILVLPEGNVIKNYIGSSVIEWLILVTIMVFVGCYGFFLRAMKKNNLERQVYFNGNFVNESEARVSIYDSALMFGDMVFEMTRSFHGKQFKLKEHLKRLYSGIKILRIPLKLKMEEMEKAVHETVEKNLRLFNIPTKRK